MPVPTKTFVWPYLRCDVLSLARPLREEQKSNAHRFGTQSRGDQVHFLPCDDVFQRGLCFRAPLEDLDLETGVLLWVERLAGLTVVVHTGLTILRTVDGVPFTKLDLAESLELVDLPADERVVVRICIGCDERATPVNSEACVRAVLL